MNFSNYVNITNEVDELNHYEIIGCMEFVHHWCTDVANQWWWTHIHEFKWYIWL